MTMGENMPDAYIFDHVRTPRGKGKKDGSLHEAPPVELATQVLASAPRPQRASTPREIEDVILGCVTPVGEQGTNIARTAVLKAGYDETCPASRSTGFARPGSKP